MSEKNNHPLIDEISELVEQKGRETSNPEDDIWHTEVKKELQELVDALAISHPEADIAEITAALETIKNNIETGDETLGKYLEITTLITGIQLEFDKVKRILELPSLIGFTGNDLIEILEALEDENIERYLQEFQEQQEENNVSLYSIPAGRAYESILAFTPQTGGDREKVEANTQAVLKILEAVTKISQQLEAPEFLAFQEAVQQKASEYEPIGEIPIAYIYQDFYITEEKKFIKSEYWEGISETLEDIGVKAKGVQEWVEFEAITQEDDFDQEALKQLTQKVQELLPDFPTTLFGLLIAQNHFFTSEDPFDMEKEFNPQKLEQVSHAYKELQKVYGEGFFDTSDEMSWIQLFNLEPEQIEAFLDPQKSYRKVWEQIAPLPGFTSEMRILDIIEISRGGFYTQEGIREADIHFYEYVEIFEAQEGVELVNLENILQIFGFSLRDLSLSRHDTAIYELASYRPFYEDVEDLYQAYPSLESAITPELALRIAEHYKENNDRFEKVTKLNTLLQRLKIPIDLSFAQASAKQEMLEKLEKSGLNPGLLDWPTTAKGHLDWRLMEDLEVDTEEALEVKESNNSMRSYLVELIDSGEVKAFYESLKTIWNIETIPAETFFSYFFEPNDRVVRENLSNPELPKTLEKLADTFEVPNIEFESLDDLVSVQSFIIRAEENLETILRNEDTIKEQRPKLHPEAFDDVGQFSRWIVSLPLLLTEEGPRYLSVLEQKPEGEAFGYNFNKTSRDFFLGRNAHASIGEVLENPDFQEAYKQVLEWKTKYNPGPNSSPPIGEPNQVMDLKIAYQIFKNPEAIPVVNLYIEHFTLDYFRTDLQWVLSVLTKNSVFVEAMENPEEFKAFITQCQEELHNTSNFRYPQDLYALAILFLQVKNNPEQKEILFSEKFTQAQELIQDTMRLNPAHWQNESYEALGIQNESYPTVLELAASGIKIETLRDWAERLNTPEAPFYPNHYTLLIAQIQEGVDLSQYEDPTYRAQLIEEISAHLPEEPFTRRKHGYLDKLERDLEWAEADGATVRSQSIRAELETLKTQYTEVPNLENLPILELSRIKYILESLQTESTQEIIGQMIVADIGDKTTEYGGIFDFTEAGLIPIEVPSDSDDDGSYGAQMYKKFHGGLLSFHFHALSTDHSEYAGPSGYGSDGGSDFGSSQGSNTSDIVFTTLGHPEGDSNKIRINADYYFVLKTGDEEQQIVIDLGIFEVPYFDPGA